MGLPRDCIHDAFQSSHNKATTLTVYTYTHIYVHIYIYIYIYIYIALHVLLLMHSPDPTIGLITKQMYLYIYIYVHIHDPNIVWVSIQPCSHLYIYLCRNLHIYILYNTYAHNCILWFCLKSWDCFRGPSSPSLHTWVCVDTLHSAAWWQSERVLHGQVLVDGGRWWRRRRARKRRLRSVVYRCICRRVCPCTGIRTVMEHNGPYVYIYNIYVYYSAHIYN